MEQFDIYANPNGVGYLLIVQSDQTPGFKTTVVAPLVAVSKMTQSTGRLHPAFQIADADFVMATHLISAVPISILKYKAGSLSPMRAEIIAALDMLFSGV